MIIPIKVFVSATTVDTPNDKIKLIHFSYETDRFFTINLNIERKVQEAEKIAIIHIDIQNFWCILFEPTFIQLMSEGSAARLILKIWSLYKNLDNLSLQKDLKMFLL